MTRQAMGFIIMGVSGCGKSTIGNALASLLACPFIEGDEFHPNENIQKMSDGIALTDADRAPWLARLGEEIKRLSLNNQHWVLSCSALKPAYRDVFRQTEVPLVFVHLKLNKEVLLQRLTQRSEHFMPSSLLDSQLATLNFDKAERDIIHLAADQSSQQIIKQLFEEVAELKP